MFECKKAHGSAADMGHRVLMYLRGRDELQHRGWALRAWLTKNHWAQGEGSSGFWPGQYCSHHRGNTTNGCVNACILQHSEMMDVLTSFPNIIVIFNYHITRQQQVLCSFVLAQWIQKALLGKTWVGLGDRIALLKPWLEARKSEENLDALMSNIQCQKCHSPLTLEQLMYYRTDLLREMFTWAQNTHLCQIFERTWILFR